MGSKQIGLFVILFTHFQFSVSSSSPLLHKDFVSDSLQEHNLGTTARHENHVNGVVGGRGRSGIMHGSKFAHGGGGRSAGGANGGGSNGATESGNGNGNGNGGAAVIPVIVAGAANRHPNNHHGAASSNRNTVGLPIMIIIILATLTVNLSVEFCCKI